MSCHAGPMYPDATPTVAVNIDCHSYLDPGDQAAVRPLCRGRAIGYSRVPLSPTQPDGLRGAVLDLQASGVASEHINIDSTPLNGARPFLAHTLSHLARGDRLLVPALSSLARSTSELFRILQVLNRGGVELCGLPVDGSTP